ncbi:MULTISPECIES: hypothetical protein [Winogradskyella]|uniref:hypothetical protein n=1 Tax=Winogradskyella TaxID=286104 RepID=UPI0015CAF86D|nr:MULTISPECIES: hypothetical protein [Winogradskyella]QNK77812.1 hypothetical protein H7F37_01600 [Winogradskyella sp. PAMC22761]QXP79185.1 hypothetical protein H0I32_00595 [Winogradskyella sp. HaHa_3_26]
MNKYKKLGLSLLFDALGLVSFIIPGIGEFSDIVWAPISGWLMTKLYKGKAGKVAGVISVVEEALPGFDVIPTFTLMWLYTYVIKKETPEIKA